MRSPEPASPLLAAQAFVIPRPVMEGTLKVLQRAGADGCEAFVVWGGVVEEGTVVFRTMVTPEQEAHRTDDGLLVTVKGEALFDVNKTLYQRGEILAAQVHSHPTGAFHSDTDDCYSLVTLAGALSIVVPHFGRDGLDGTGGWAWYRLVGKGKWSPLTAADSVAIVELEQ
jgi:hypothetical protein